MTTLVITGMDRDRAARIAEGASAGRLRIVTSSDYEGVLALKAGDADYYVGICQSGAGGALALAIGLLGSARCATVSRAGSPPGPTAVDEAFERGAVAFGMASEHIDEAVPRIVRVIVEREEGSGV